MSDRSEKKRQRLRTQHGDGCWICGEAMDFANPRAALGATLDHIVPRSRGRLKPYQQHALGAQGLQ